jgi:hypothetical protein
MFDLDDQFLVKTFENIVCHLPESLIRESKANGSYYDFHIKTSEFIIVPHAMNFTFKYVHLIKDNDPEYWSRLIKGWDKLISPNFGDPLDILNKTSANLSFDDTYNHDAYGIMPPLLHRDDHFMYFKNLETEAEPLSLTMTTAFKFSKLYSDPVIHKWNDYVNIYIFPVNNIGFYGLVNNKLTMLYPKWNSYRWSIELPKFIVDSKNLGCILKFKQFDIDAEQETIRIMNGALDKEIFR